MLTVAALAGLFATVYVVPVIECALTWINGNEPLFPNSDKEVSSDRFQVNLSLLVMSLPVLLVLWWFRTYDTRQQIEKTQEQIKESAKSREASTYDNLLSTGLNLIASDNVAGRCIGLIQLALVWQESPRLRDQIDASTQELTLYIKGTDGSEAEIVKLRGAMLKHMNFSGAFMKEAHLQRANLEGALLGFARLEGAHLRFARLEGAYLFGANLKGADLRGAYLEGADLKGADLRGAYLEGADLDGANLDRAQYNESTSFPKGFDPKARGLINIDET